MRAARESKGDPTSRDRAMCLSGVCGAYGDDLGVARRSLNGTVLGELQVTLKGSAPWRMLVGAYAGRNQPMAVAGRVVDVADRGGQGAGAEWNCARVRASQHALPDLPGALLRHANDSCGASLARLSVSPDESVSGAWVLCESNGSESRPLSNCKLSLLFAIG